MADGRAARSHVLSRANAGRGAGAIAALALAVAIAVAASGCGRDRLSTEDALAHATPHLEAFERFDSWARRAIAAHTAFRGDEALEETVFAPLRRDDDALASWIAMNDELALVYGERESPPEQIAWTALRDARLGELEVTLAKLPPPGRRDETRQAVLIRRTVRREDGARVTVILARARSVE